MVNVIKQEIELEKYLRNKCFECLGRRCTENEYEEWLKEHYEQIKEESKEREKIEEEARIKKEEARIKKEETRRQRESLLVGRLDCRNILPENYNPVLDTSTLDKRSNSGSSYAERTKIRGDENAYIDIDFDLELFNLSNSDFKYVRFKKECNLNRAVFKKSRFSHVIFEEGVDLSEADFEDAEFHDVKFSRECNIKGAAFRFVKFRRDVSIEFDRNYIANATFDSKRSDVWVKLSLSYAGIWQYVNITLSGLYFGAILLKLYFLKALSIIYSSIIKYDDDALLWQVETIEVSALKFVFGEQNLSIAIAVLILIYQSLRLFLTTKISPLIEDEKRSGYTPDRDSYIGYSFLNFLIKMLGIVVLALFSYEIWELFQIKLVIPISIGDNGD
ncbi:MAG: pentapeptide repeat-containing protein [Gammaproteobacteria bacterium]|nr:pentapeptide repeat-containing protein [Gammaproteobacteria bacterium]MBU1722665.1 pentapeptide repeat-containing protein [Gammaproteobacteria bacterium]MBU2006712.1 pentapeptide repeat-containing protein [Gammaproteobacteria bacterium]